eukprot:24258-Hanusia_phi.AAC.1
MPTAPGRPPGGRRCDRTERPPESVTRKRLAVLTVCHGPVPGQSTGPVRRYGTVRRVSDQRPQADPTAGLSDARSDRT